jgi:methionine-rich copper-binding protein CopC
MGRRWYAVVLAGLVTGAVVAPSAALAHGGLAVTTPADGSTVARPVEAVSLTFTEKPAPFAYFTITAPSGTRVDQGWSHAEPVRLAKPVTEYNVVDGVWVPKVYDAGFPVKVNVAHWPAPGTYVVRYHTVASDGDAVMGKIQFTYTGAVTPPPAGWQPPADQPKPELYAAASSPASPGAEPVPSAQTLPLKVSAERSSIWIWLVPALLLAAAVLAYLVIRPPSWSKRR